MADTEQQELLNLVRFKALKGAKAAGYPMTQVYLDRMEYELGIINKTGFATYFLIVADLCRFMREENIRYNPRGSGCGSVVVWYMGISHNWLDPVKYSIPFERFLNPDRVSNPDIDIDIDDSRRHLVVAYTIEKYGVDRVARIVTFGTQGAKTSIADYARALRIPEYQVVAAEISSAIPAGKGEDGKNIRMEDLLPRSEFLREKKVQYPELFYYAMKGEGKIRHSGIHAAGVIIAPDITTKFLPVLFQGNPADREPSDWFPTTQWDMYDVEARGLLKMDYLGLKTLRVIDETNRMVNVIRGINGQPQNFDIDRVSQVDDNTWKLLSEGRLLGVFQVERSFVRNFAKRMSLNKTRDIWQLAILISIIRPGMMDTGMTEEFLLRSNGQSPPTSPHPLLEEALRNNYGCLIFQEDVMKVAEIIAGYTKSQADSVRAIMGKKKIKEMAKEEPKFVAASIANKITAEGAAKIWQLLAAFARYGFNTAHALAYAIGTYQTAYLKANHTLPYMMALINSESGVGDKERGYNFKVAEYVEEARAMGIKILPPSVTSSRSGCSIRAPYVDEIIFGLSLIKKVSTGAVDWINKRCRRTVNIKEFIMACYENRQVQREVKVDATGKVLKSAGIEWRNYAMVGKTDMDALLAAGAFDCFDRHRPKLKVMIPILMGLAEKFHAQTCKAANGVRVQKKPEDIKLEYDQYTLEDDQIPESTLEEILEQEREVTGCYLSESPFAPFSETIRNYTTCTVGELLSGNAGEGPFQFAAMISSLRETVIKNGKSKGKPMAIMALRGLGGDIDSPAFSQPWDDFTRLPDGNKGPPLKTIAEKGKSYIVQVVADRKGTGFLIENMWRLSKKDAA